jgi:integral membrane protein (TIGR01906 family)
MKIIRKIIGIICAVAVLLIVLLTAVQISVYSDMNFYEKEYSKYQVLDDVSMEMADVMDVTKEMLSYLRGSREDLHVWTVINGESKEFFNEREIAHMEDVQVLFSYGFLLRRICVIVLIIGLILLKLVCKGSIRKDFCRSFIGVTVAVAVAGIALVIYLSQDFTKGFVQFHHLFFSNDLWLLDPDTDLLINILPEGFFVDMALRIGKIFGMGMVVLLVGSIVAGFGKIKIKK